MSQQAAVVGMGQMGSGMAGRLKESGYDIVGYDVNPDQRTRLAQGRLSDGLAAFAEALAGRDVVLTSLPDPKAVT